MRSGIKHQRMLNLFTLAVFVFGLKVVCWAEDRMPQGLTVDLAIQVAMKNNLQRRIAKGNIEIAQDKTAQAESAYGPKLTLDGGYYHYNEPPSMVQLKQGLVNLNNGLSKMTGGQVPLQESPSDSLNYYGLRLQLTQPLYTGNKLTATKMQAKANEENSKANMNAGDNDLVLAVKKSYYTVLLCQQLGTTMDEAVMSMEDHLKEATEYFRVNVVSHLDVLRAEEKLADLKQQQLLAQNNLSLARSSLNYVMGVDLNTVYSFDEQMGYGKLLLKLTSCQDEALAKRPELEAMDAKIEMARQGVSIARSGNKPTVALVANRHHYEPENEAPSTTVGVVASFKLYDHGMVSHQVAEAEDVLNQAMIGKEQLQQGIRLEVEQAYRNVEASIKSIEVSEKSLDTAKETLRAAQTRYKVGLSTSLERLDAEIGLTRAKTNFTQALSMCNIAMAELDRAMGKGTNQAAISDPIQEN